MAQLYLSKPSLELLYSISINQNFNTPPETKHISYGTRYQMYNSSMYIASTYVIDTKTSNESLLL